jgi:hypothetical protein
MARPKKPDAERKSKPVQLRLDEGEKVILGRLVASRAEEMRASGTIVTQPSVLRWLILREAATRGLDKPVPMGATP